MEINNLLAFTDRQHLREWLRQHHLTDASCWVVCSRSASAVPGTLPYLDIVEEALCFGWIDSTLKKLPDGRLAQRLSPRRKGSHWTERNIERCRQLEARGLMTDAGRKALPPPHITALVALIVCLGLTSCKTHQYVDLGLPSGTLWATCNLGADRPEDFGDFYAWGETTPKEAYTPENYTFLTARTSLSVRADAARRRWHGRWRIPTVSQWAELRDACIWTWLPEWAGHGTAKGYRIIGPNGNAIFLPAAGDIDGATHYGINTYGDYWSSTLRPDDTRQAQGFILYSDGAFMLYNWSRHSGHSIRPVKRQRRWRN